MTLPVASFGVFTVIVTFLPISAFGITTSIVELTFPAAKVVVNVLFKYLASPLYVATTV